MRWSWMFLAVGAAAGLVGGCSDATPAGPPPAAPAGPAVGTLVVTTSTTGEDIDPDGYWVWVDGPDWPHIIGVNSTLTIYGLAAGDREVELTEVASNCAVVGENPRTVTVPADGTVNTDFDLNCEAIEPDE